MDRVASDRDLTKESSIVGASSPQLQPYRLATFALVAIAAWPVLVIVLHVLQRDQYDPVQQAMSELANGRYGFLMNIAFVLLGLGVLLLAYGLRRTVSHWGLLAPFGGA